MKKSKAENNRLDAYKFCITVIDEIPKYPIAYIIILWGNIFEVENYL